MALCVNCSEEIFSGKICYKCGTHVGGPVGANQSTPMPQPSNQQQQTWSQPHQSASSSSTTAKSMSFTDSIKYCLSNYANFKGRASRSEFWYFVLFCFLVYFATALLSPELYLVAVLGLFIPTIAAAIRRFHDGDRSGWSLLLVFVPLGGIVVLVWLASKGKTASNRYG